MSEYLYLFVLGSLVGTVIRLWILNKNARDNIEMLWATVRLIEDDVDRIDKND